MSDLPTSGNDGDQFVTVSFTRKQFSDFVFKHVQTPSEEVRRTKMGFDLTKHRLKSIVDKVDYYVGKNNRLMNRDFSSTISVDDNQIIKRGSYEDFFYVDTVESVFLNSVSVTLSYLVDFGLEDGPPQPEKQVVVIRFDTTKPADIATEIRTTEFTWPAAIFTLVQKELDDIAGELQDVNPISQSPLFSPARLLSKSGDKILTFAVLPLMLMPIFMAMFTFVTIPPSVDQDQNAVYIFNQDTKNFVEVNPDDYFESSDWRESLSFARDSKELKSYLGASAGGGDGEGLSAMKAIKQFLSLPAWLYALSIVSSVFAWLNFREGARIRENRIGRIWLSSRKLPARQGIAPSEGILSALVIGVAGSATFAAVMAALGSLVD